MPTLTRSSRISEGWRSVATVLLLSVLMAGCQSLVQAPAQPASGETGRGGASITPEYRRQLEQVDRMLAATTTDAGVADARRTDSLQPLGEQFRDLVQAGPATDAEFPLWGTYFNRLSDLAEGVVRGDLSPGEVEPLYGLAAELYQRFLDRSHLPERPYVAVDGETSAFYAGNYFLCTMPEVIVDAYGRLGSRDLHAHLERAMVRYLEGPCEPDLMFSAAEMLYDYALVSGPHQADYRTRIEQAGPGQSRPWLDLLDNLGAGQSAGERRVRLDQAMTDARRGVDPGDEVSDEFQREWNRQHRLLSGDGASLERLTYQP